MLIRIVRMHFQPEQLNNFRQIFEESKPYILEMPGCLMVELWQDADEPAVMITHSHWVDRESLNAYRSTPFFREVWGRTKALFQEKPQVFSAYIA